MQLRVLGCQGGSAPARHLPGLLLDGTVLLEAGSVTSTLSLAEQLEIRHVLLSHAHLDHTGGLAYLADNRCCHRISSGNGHTLTVASVSPAVEDLHDHFFNDRIWPDFSAIPTVRDPIVRLQTLQPCVPQQVGDRLTVIPVPVHHAVPAVGVIVHDDAGALVSSGDTGPTEQLWDRARAIGNVRAIIVETSFPNRFDALAEVSGHMTPNHLARELDKMPPATCGCTTSSPCSTTRPSKISRSSMAVSESSGMVKFTTCDAGPSRRGDKEEGMTTVEPASEPISSERPGPRLQRAWRVASSALVLGAVLTAAPVLAQTSPPATPAAPASEQKPAEAPQGPNTGRLSINAGVDWTSAYFFRGIKQETEDLILQPYGEVSFKLVDNAGALTSLSLTPGIWNSLQTGPTGSDSPTASDPKVWYELDAYVRLSALLWEDLTTYALYTAYTSPNNAFGTVQEIAFGVGYNDAKLLGPFALTPSFLVAFELDGQADAGAEKGIYAQIGIAPATPSWPTRSTRWPSPSPCWSA